MALVLVLASLCDLGDAGQDASAERIIRKAITTYRPARSITVLNPPSNDGYMNVDATTVRTWSEAVHTRVPVWKERLLLSKLYSEQKRNGTIDRERFCELSMKDTTPSRQVFNQAITQGRAHSLYVVFCVAAESASTNKTSKGGMGGAGAK